MIDFILVIILFVYLLLVLSFAIKEYIIGLIAGIGFIVIGIYLAIYGVGDVNNFLTQAFALINIGLGSYIFIYGSMEKIQELM